MWFGHRRPIGDDRGPKAADYHGQLIFLANDEQRETHPQLFKVFKHLIYV